MGVFNWAWICNLSTNQAQLNRNLKIKQEDRSAVKYKQKKRTKSAMPNLKLPNLIIGNLVVNPPIIQGGMGVRVSKANLASAVANEGGIGVIAAAGLGDEEACKIDYVKYSELALREEIRKAKKMTKGCLGVNIMVALANYDSLVEASCEEGIDIIISGAGLPLNLPAYTKDYKTKLAPIVSSGRAAELICKTWNRKYKRLPDALIVEGPLAGGHLGFNMDELNHKENFLIEKLLKDVLMVAKDYENTSNGSKIPVIAAGGIFDGVDIAKILKIGASGVQMASRFVCTHECDASDRYKEEFLKAEEKDIVLINSPVGLPGRVIENEFVKRIERGEKIRFDCPYRCLRTCEPAHVNYCIADALVNASKGDLKNGFAMCGANAHRINKIVSVKELLRELVDEATKEYYKS